MAIGITGGLNPWFGPAPDYGSETELLPASIAVLGEDLAHLRPGRLVEQGARVQAGDVLVKDRHRPELRHVAPVSGTVTEIVRGPRRSFERLVLEVDGDDARSFAIPPDLDREALVGLLVETGLWTSLRTRPFERIPRPDQHPDALFVTAIDTRPLAPDPVPIIASRADWFARGLSALSRLTAGKTYLCHAAGATLPDVVGIDAVAFAGPHPAGLAGTHIHRLHPVGRTGSVWHIGYQDVLAVGHLLETGRLWTRRIVGLAGDGVAKPALLETLAGADLHQVCAGRLADTAIHLLSGSPLDGRVAHYLGKRHTQITALRHRHLPEHRRWIDDLSAWLTRGSGAIVPNARHERATPPGILPMPFLRAINVGDLETARRLGALELAEEDLALLTHVDGGGTDFGALLRDVLDELEANQ